MNKAKKRFSVIIATLNSERTIESCLNSLRSQDYPQEEVEILLIDGGSTDKTREIAQKYHCRILENPDVVPVAAKLIGMKEATGDYLMHLDSDEVLTSAHALTNRRLALESSDKIVMVFSAGYRNPEHSAFVNQYINEFGDPFSAYYYRLSKDERFFLPTMKARYVVQRETDEYVIFDVSQGPQPILENAAQGNTIDLEFFRRHFSELCAQPSGPVHFFYHMQKYTQLFAVTKNEAVIHYSADTWRGFLGKIKWRVKNNVFSLGNYGSSGFLGREQVASRGSRLKKYLFIPYTILVVPVLADAIYLCLTRRNVRYLGHIILSWITVAYIGQAYLQKLLGFRPEFRSYGEQRPVK